MTQPWRVLTVPNGSLSCQPSWPTPDTSTRRLDFSRPGSVTPAGAGLNPKVLCAQRMSPTGGSSPSEPEQTTAATATARHLRRQLTSLTAALETLPLGRQSLAVVGSASSAQAAAREVHLAGPALAHVHRDRLAPTHDTTAVRSALVGGSDRRNVAGEGLTSRHDLALSIRSSYLSQIWRTSTTLGQHRAPPPPGARRS